MKLGDRLKQLRKARKLTQENIADRLHISRATYAQYEINRRVPEYETLKKLADFFEESIDFLVGRDVNRTGEDLTANETEFIIREIVKEYDLDLTLPGQREKLEDLIKLVVTDYTKKQ